MGRIKKEAIRAAGYTLLVLFFFAALLLLEGTPSNANGITGFQVADVEQTLTTGTPVPEDLLAQVKAFANSFPLTKDVGDGAEICLLIDFGNNNVKSFDLFKDGGVVEVTESKYSTYCNNDPNNQGSEDFVIQYVDYASFKDHITNPTCDKFKNNGQGNDFYYLPSEFVKLGGDAVCNRVFQVRYCPAISQCLSNSDLAQMGMDCCIEKKGLYRIPGFGTWQFYAAAGVFFVVLFGMVLLLIHFRHKEAQIEKKEATYHAGQIEEYILKGMKTGHTEDEIHQKLLDAGWDEEFITPVFESVRMQKKN
ncbi:MAG: hypothetical protein Q7R76_05575 [Candidatus Woesearchaeota archaeon]|nr:hypothetical protein [Candidatus Woesearchaeota archaeon]